jgi:transcriptional regulator with XRE-family HTH domain
MGRAVASFWTVRFRNQANFVASIARYPSQEKKFRNTFGLPSAVEKKHPEVDEGNGMRRQNITGLRVAYLRSQKKWTQQILAAKLQCEDVDITRLSVARIEYGVLKVSDTVLVGLQRVFRVPIVQFFPQQVQILDEKFAQRIVTQLQNPSSTNKPRRKCQKLTKQREEV